MGSSPRSDSELLLGYDVRSKDFDVKSLWPTLRRQQYLILPEVDKPLSTDVAVWPTLVDRRVQGYSLAEWIGPLAPIWERLEDLKSNIERHLREHSCFIAIALAMRGLSELDVSRFRNDRGSPSPSSIDPSWRFLGYDISDEGLLSGLMNCGYPDDPAQKLALRSKWGAHLNANHLFENQGKAFMFKEYADDRVPEHAPFFVYGLWLIEDGMCYT